MKPETIEQGETYDLSADYTGDDVSGLSVAFKVLQYPGDTPDITGTMSYTNGEFKGVLTSAQTTSLFGEYRIHITSTDSDEDIRDPIKLYISKTW